MERMRIINQNISYKPLKKMELVTSYSSLISTIYSFSFHPLQ